MQIPPGLRYTVDEARWGKSFDPTNTEHHTEEIINGYITCMLACYRTDNRKDEDLWQIFHEDFEGFTYEIFKIAHRVALRDLREQLVSQGVWVKGAKGSTSYAKVLQECLEEETPYEWTEAEIKEKRRIVQSMLQTQTQNPSQQPITQPFQQQIQTPLVQTPETLPQAALPQQTQPQWNQHQTYEQRPRQQYQPYEQARDDVPAKLLTDLMKIYSNDDKKYGGEEYDILDAKLQVFYDCCSKIGLLETQYHHAYSIMLKGRASSFYYDKIASRSYDFQIMVAMTKTHFETEENHQKYLSEWRETTLIRTISENPGKSRLECLQIMIDKLQKVQRGLTKEYHYEHNLRDQVINTYYKHHKEKLSMVTSSYDPCLLITTTKEVFGVVGMQTDDTLFLGSEEFATLEDNELQKAKLSAKPRDELSPTSNLIFNGCVLTQASDDTMILLQKDQGKKLQLVNAKEDDYQQQYLEQRARGAYIASTCQPEASYDLSVAAQHQNPTEDDIRALNKRIEWQMKNMDRGIKYIALDLTRTKLFVFVDGSFANNKDFSSQIGHLIILANETSTGTEEFEIKGNLIHYSSTKSKRVTRSVLASEIYGMVGGVDMAIAINTTIKMITEQLDLPQTPTVVCTDSYSLYECLVKLGTTKEKRLMIDIMALRQSYERREITEIRWIDGKDNPADAMTKSVPNRALEKFLTTNHLPVRVDGWVQRKGTEE